MNGAASVQEDATACAAVDATTATGEDDCLSVNLNTPGVPSVVKLACCAILSFLIPRRNAQPHGIRSGGL